MQIIRIIILPILFIALIYAPWYLVLLIVIGGIILFPWFIEGFAIYTLHSIMTNGTGEVMVWLFIAACLVFLVLRNVFITKFINLSL
jgi:hypothetical protein